MNDKQKNNSSKNIETNLTSTKSSKKQKIKKRNERKFQLFICIKSCFVKLIKKWELFHSKFSLTSQTLLVSIPFLIFLYFALFFGNYFGYEKFLKFDFYNIIKKQYLKYIINDIDDIHLDLGISEIKSQFEDLDNIYFFQIYFKELISMGLLEEDSPTKIYPKVSQISESYFKYHDLFQNENKINNIYSIPKEESEKFIDNREDPLSEIGKIYYYMLPYITFEAFTKKTYINETFLIAYEFDDNKNIINDELYLTFPKLKTELDITNNFIPSFLSPQIVKNKTIFDEKKNNSFYIENWFIKQDYEFREKANNINNYNLSFVNLIYDYFGKLNKTNIIISQNYINIKEKSYIINIIYYINKKELNDGEFQHSIFLLFNNKNNSYENEKYSDNSSFLFSKSNIIELSLSSKLYDYFYYGMNNKNNSFFKYGISFDSFDLETLGEPLRYYESTQFFNIDLRYFKISYLYALLFKNFEYEEIKEQYKEITTLKFEKNESILHKICSVFNFPLYINYLIKNNIDCWDAQNLLYYINETSEIRFEEDISLGEYISKPYCICLPLYCLKNPKKDYNFDKIEYMDKINLPSKCQNNYSYYWNYIDEEFKIHQQEFDPVLEINYGLNDLDLFTKNIKSVLEEEYYIFKNIKLNQFNEISMMIATCVDNNDIKYLTTLFITYINLFKAYYLLFILIGMFIAFLFANIFLYRNIKKISNIIFEYQRIYEKFSSQLEATSQTEMKENNNNLGKKIENNINNNNFEYNSFIKNKNINLKSNYVNYLLYSNENILLKESFRIFCDYYNISKSTIIKMIKNSNEEDNNQNLILEENELFYFLRILSFYIAKFKLHITMDYNFYINSKLNKNFMKTCSKNMKMNNQIIMLTQSIIFELLSTELIEDCGLITNFYFKYITNINLYSKYDSNSIKESLFNCTKDEEESSENNINNDKSLIEEKDNKKSIFIIRREENTILNEFESNFENDDYLKKEKLIPSFDSFLINVYYKNIKKLLFNTEKASFQE